MSCSAVMDGATAVIDRSYSRGDTVNLTAITENAVSGRNENYTYTAANRLQNADGPWGTLTYGYDGVGNRTSEVLTVGGDGVTSSYAYPTGTNKLSTVTPGGGAGAHASRTTPPATSRPTTAPASPTTTATTTAAGSTG